MAFDALDFDEIGPLRTFGLRPTAAAQLYQTGHSSIAQHFRTMKVGTAGPSCRSLRVQPAMRRPATMRSQLSLVVAIKLGCTCM